MIAFVIQNKYSLLHLICIHNFVTFFLKIEFEVIIVFRTHKLWISCRGKQWQHL